MSELLERLQRNIGDAYRIERELGGGGMSRVFLATETALNRPVVIKLLSPELTSDVMSARFKREFEVTAQLQHPHIVPVLSTGAREGLLYYITPFIAGESVRQRLQREGRLPIDDAVRILSEVLAALSYAHGHGVVHRDIKPENILLSDGHAVLADFGIAAALAGEKEQPQSGATRLTAVGMSIGTPGYMSPEQATGERVVDGRSDLYSLAIVAYEMLSGEPPFTGESVMSVITKHLTEVPKPITTFRDDVPAGLEAALAQALEKDPKARFQTADEFRKALGISYSGGGRAFSRPRRRRFAIIGGAAVAAIAAAATVLAGGRREKGLDANLVAIAPFDILKPDLGVWKEGIVDVLAANLDGAGPLRTVAPSSIVRRWSGKADTESARTLGRQTRAGLAVFGRLVGVGRDSVEVKASILDVSTGRKIGGDVLVRQASDRMDRVTDELTVSILRELSSVRAIAATRTAAGSHRNNLGTESFPAIKEYLQGEQYYRTSQWDSAALHYERAIAIDSNFAPAMRHLSNALGWQVSPQGQANIDGYRWAILAGQRNVGLAPRESLLVAADSIFGALMTTARTVPAPKRFPLVTRLHDMLEDGTRRYAGDAEVWFKFGDAQFHFSQYFIPSRTTVASMRQAFERSMQLDSAFAPAYLHDFLLAGQDQDLEGLKRATQAYLALEPTDVYGRSMRIVQSLLVPRARNRALVDSVIKSGDVATVMSAFSTMQQVMDSAETQLMLSEALADWVKSGDAPPQLSRGSKEIRVATLLSRGHVQEALALADSTQPWAYLEAAFLGVVPVDSVVGLFDRWMAANPNERNVQSLSMFLWMAQRDTARFAARMREIAADTAKAGGPLPYFRGLHALARADTAEAIRALTVPDSACIGYCPQLRFPLARIYVERKQWAQAAPLLDPDFPQNSGTKVLYHLLRAQVNEGLGNRAKAIDGYLYVTNAWAKSDKALKPYVDQARDGLKRLQTDRARS